MPPRRNAVITGVGVASPIGVGRQPFWAAVEAGKSGVGPLAMYPSGSLPVTIGAEIVDFDPRPYVRQRKSLKIMSRDILLAVAAADLAVQDAGLTSGTFDPDRLGVEFGAHTMHSELADLDPAYRVCLHDGRFDFSHWGEEALGAMHPLWMLKYLPNMPACHVAICQDARGPNNSITQNEVSSLLAVAGAVRAIERGVADVMIAGGTGSRVHPKFWASSLLFDELSHRNHDPTAASRPFDADRDGQVNGEGAAAFILEEESFARARGARVFARILGYGAGFEARLPDKPLTGSGIQVAIRAALRDAGLAAKDVGHVNAHGLSTREDDRAEAAAIRALLGDVAVTAPKSYFGNLGAGTGAVEMAVSVLALAEDQVPPTLNYQRPDADCPIHVIHTRPLVGALPVAICLNHTSMGQTVGVVISH